MSACLPKMASERAGGCGEGDQNGTKDRERVRGVVGLGGQLTLLYSCSNLAAISCLCLLVRDPSTAIIASSSLPVIE